MSVSAILDAIRQAGDAQVIEIENSIEAQIHEVLHNAHMNGEKILEDTRASTVVPAYAERAEILHHARLKALQTIGNIRENLVDAALKQTQERLAEMRSDVAYPEVLRRLTEEAIAELLVSLKEPAAYWLEADPRDQYCLEYILLEKNLSIHVSYTLKVWGGVIARSQDNRVVVVNTLESRMERASPFLRRYLAANFQNVNEKAELQRSA